MFLLGSECRVILHFSFPLLFIFLPFFATESDGEHPGGEGVFHPFW